MKQKFNLKTNNCKIIMEKQGIVTKIIPILNIKKK